MSLKEKHCCLVQKTDTVQYIPRTYYTISCQSKFVRLEPTPKGGVMSITPLVQTPKQRIMCGLRQEILPEQNSVRSIYGGKWHVITVMPSPQT